MKWTDAGGYVAFDARMRFVAHDFLPLNPMTALAQERLDACVSEKKSIRQRHRTAI
jgi:hypothetical protein